MLFKKKTVSLLLCVGPNHAVSTMSAALAACGLYAAGSIWLPAFSFPMTGIAAAFGLYGITRIPRARQSIIFNRKLTRLGIDWCTMQDLAGKIDLNAGPSADRWLGYGFHWEPSHRQAMSAFMNEDWHTAFTDRMKSVVALKYFREHRTECRRHPLLAYRAVKALQKRIAQMPGYNWVHLLGEERDLYLTKHDLEGHMAVFGTTGSGKTRFLDHQISQAVMRGETVIVLDPKGDIGIETNMRQVCEACGRRGKFIRMHLSFPENSARINLLANYGEIGELASRISDTLPGRGGSSQAFIDMGAGVLRTILEGLELMNIKPSFKRLHHYYICREELAAGALEGYILRRLGQDGLDEALKNRGIRTKFEALLSYYKTKMKPDVSVDSIISLAERDPENLRATTTGTFNLITQLSSGPIGRLLSPDDLPDDLSNDQYEDGSLMIDTRSIIEKNQVVYVGLSAMTDSSLARAIGSMFLSDLTATAGRRYSFDDASHPVALFVDEASEMVCEPFTQLLNKSRGAKFSICLATQTISDFVKNAGSRDEMLRILANLNNFIALRTPDPGTQDFLTKRILKTVVKSTQRSHGVSTQADGLLAQGGSISEQEIQREAELIPKELLGSLPNLEFIGVVAGGNVIKARVPLLLKDAGEFK